MRLPGPLLLRLSAAAQAGGWALLLLVLVLSHVYEQTTLADEVWCLLRRETGLACPGCGLTRAFCAMSHLRITAAFQAHLAGPSLYATALYTVLRGALRLLIRWDLPPLWAYCPRLVRGWWALLILLFGINLGRTTLSNLATILTG